MINLPTSVIPASTENPRRLVLFPSHDIIKDKEYAKHIHNTDYDKIVLTKTEAIKEFGKKWVDEQLYTNDLI